MITYITERLKEPSTWRGIIGLITAVGVTLQPEQVEAIIAAGIGLAGVVAVFTKDAK